ncbi:fimbria/pilus outer membrane usher protein [Pseudomonas graminis]
MTLHSQAAGIDKTFAIVNNIYHGRITLSFSQDFACLTQPLLEEWGFLPAIDARAVFSSSGCLLKSELERWNIGYDFDDKAQLITLIIPDDLKTHAKNDIAPSRWDDGIPALFTSYHLNYQRTNGSKYRYQTDKNNLYISLESGINLAGWRFRVGQQYQKSNYGERGWLTRNVSMSRTIRPIRAQLTLGDSMSPSSLFDNFNYRGAMLASDERMLPDGLRQFSPTIRGIAKTNAEVVLRQNGTVIYQTFVAPGPFTLRDVYPPGSEGDLEMTITESDGTETLRTMPYAAMPNLTHHNMMNYQFLVGHYKSWPGSELDEPSFVQGTVTYGLSKRLSVFTGGMSSPLFKSWGAGIGFGMGRGGAISVDRRSSVAVDPRKTEDDKGSVWRMRYAKAFFKTGTSLSVQAQYFPRGQRYRNFEETINQQKTYWWDWDDEGVYDGDFDPERLNSYSLYLNQSIAESSSIYMTLMREKWRQKDEKTTSLTLGLDHTWNNINYDVALSWERAAQMPANGEITFRVSIPLGSFGNSRPKLGLSRTFAHHGERSQQFSISGSALDDYSLNYSLGAQHSQTRNDSMNASLGYEYNAGELRAGIAIGGNIRQRNIDISGSVMVHPYGITLGQTLGETMALVEVDRSPGIGIDNQFGVTTDSRGFALVSYLTPYRVNRLTLDGFNLPETLELPETEYDVVPTPGSVVFGRFASVEPKKE